MIDEPQVKARGMKVEVPHPLRESLPLVASPIKLSRTPAVPAVAPPLFGQHTRPVLQRLLGLSDSELAELSAAAIIQDA